ncbi:minor capsid protein [Deinococcus multiflagellatus]|uniref:Minor capsid protein n=1 Tax=Deinococcus multiflagellatus TaxID=1656887 RepID=A0ABW1ZGX1_9DEIO|nr:minor capsid protein [Deinococcus multiflagellatus]MBZ9712189.1 minor capsid protein [Deinococcus multiflagellatus]
MNPAQKRLIEQARAAEEEALAQARGAALRQFQQVNLKAAERALKAALSLPRAQRPAALRGVLQLISEAAKTTGLPPAELLRVVRRSVQDRALNTRDLSVLTDPALVFPDPREAAAAAVQRQRREMNRYWAKESQRFRDDAARTAREALRKNLSAEQAADLLQERLNVSRSRAVLIAQDQLLTAAATAERNLLKAAGVKEFQWRSLMDGRQRRAHELLHGRVFTWRSAPELPGQAIRCRCRAVVPLKDVSRAGEG